MTEPKLRSMMMPLARQSARSFLLNTMPTEHLSPLRQLLRRHYNCTDPRVPAPPEFASAMPSPRIRKAVERFAAQQGHGVSLSGFPVAGGALHCVDTGRDPTRAHYFFLSIQYDPLIIFRLALWIRHDQK